MYSFLVLIIPLLTDTMQPAQIISVLNITVNSREEKYFCFMFAENFIKKW